MDDPKVGTDGPGNFWKMVAALKTFIKVNKRLPVNGGIPDMIAKPHFYLSLQSLYQKKARDDRDKIWCYLEQIMDGDTSAVNKNLFDIFCKNARSLTVSRMQTLE